MIAIFVGDTCFLMQLMMFKSFDSYLATAVAVADPQQIRRPVNAGLSGIRRVSGYPEYAKISGRIRRIRIRRDIRDTNRTYSKTHVEIPLRKKVTSSQKVPFNEVQNRFVFSSVTDQKKKTKK